MKANNMSKMAKRMARELQTDGIQEAVNKSVAKMDSKIAKRTQQELKDALEMSSKLRSSGVQEAVNEAVAKVDSKVAKRTQQELKDALEMSSQLRSSGIQEAVNEAVAKVDSKIGQRHKASPLTPEGVREVTGNNLFGGIPTPSTDTFDLIQELSGRGIHSGNGINIPESKGPVIGPVRPQSKTGPVGGPTVKNSTSKRSETPQLNKINERNRAKSKAAEKAAVQGDKTIMGLTSKQLLGTAVGGGLIFSMFNRGGQQSNAELYGQSTPYGGY